LVTGTAEYALRSSRFEVPTSAAALDVYSTPELTVCYDGTGSCPPETQGSEELGGVGSVVGLRLLVQQMCSSTSSAVGLTTYYPSTGNMSFSISSDEHHKKAHLALPSVTFASSCPGCPGGVCTGRSFIVKSRIEYLAGNPVKVEYGDSGSAGYSTSFAFVGDGQ